MPIELVQIPKSEWKRIVAILDKLDKAEEESWITEREAAEWMGMELSSFRNLVYNKTIPPTSYKLTLSNKRVYKKSTLIKPI